MIREELNYGYQARVLWREEKNRYDFYHSSHGNRHGGNCFRIAVVDERTTEKVKYSVHIDSILGKSRFPLRELMYTFVEQIGVGLHQLEFRFKGEVVSVNATPSSLGMSFKCENIISVRAVSCSHEERTDCFTLLNRMGKVNVGVGPHQGGDAFGTDLLPRILEYAGLKALVSACQVCRHWYHVAQRFSVLIQLQDGDADSWQNNQRYPLLLHEGCRHSFNLALCQAGTDAEESKWNSTTMQKERTDNHSFGYCKAAGCRMVKTVEMQSISRDLASKWEALNDAKTAFMKCLESAQHAPQDDSKMSTAEKKTEQPQEFPPVGDEGNGYITEALDWRYKNCAVELYRRYFSPDMYYIFPLIVNQQAAVGLDFRSCVTSLIFGTPSATAAPPRPRFRERHTFIGSRPLAADDLPSPLGSVSWRIHDAKEIALVGTGLASRETGMDETDAEPLVMVNGSKPQVVLEVLFIAVWESDRGGEYGSTLVASLESKATQYAKSQGLQSVLLYVEIGYEQPKAKTFWGNNGFALVVEKAKGKHSQDDILTGRVVALEDWQLGFIDRRCLRFKDTEQYAKRVVVG